MMFVRVNPKFCVNPFEVRIEQSLFAAAAGLSSCRLINRITPEGLDVKCGEAVHFILGVQPRRCYSGMRSVK